MEFTSANPSVVRSITQRVLLNAWLRAARRHQPLPLLADFEPGDIASELPDMMGYDVEGDGEEARFIIKQEGGRPTATYGNEDVDPARRTNRYLHEAIGPDRYARVVPSYIACVRLRRPTYSVSTVQDADGKEVSYERLLMPFGSAEAVQQIIGSFKSISIEGGFKISNLLGLRPKAEPVILARAIIDRAFKPAQSGRHSSDEIIELD